VRSTQKSLVAGQVGERREVAMSVWSVGSKSAHRHSKARPLASKLLLQLFYFVAVFFYYRCT
jgi:hypothetical protein